MDHREQFNKHGDMIKIKRCARVYTAQNISKKWRLVKKPFLL